MNFCLDIPAPPDRPYRPKLRWDLNQFFGPATTELVTADDRDLRGDYDAFSGWVRPGHAPADGAFHTYVAINPINANPASYVLIWKDVLNFLAMGVDAGGGIQVAFVPVNAGNFAQNVWHHIGGSWSADGIRLYLDGALAGQLGGPVLVGDAALPAGSNIIFGSAFIFDANSDLAWWKFWREIPPDERMVWDHGNERGFFGV